MDNNPKGVNNQSSNKALKIGIIIASVFVVIILCAGSFFAGTIVSSIKYELYGFDSKSESVLKDIKDVEKYSLLFDVRDALISKYDGEIDDQKMLEGAIKGMTASLEDPYTVYMNPEEYKSFMEQSEGSFVGIGVQIGVKDNKVTVIAPIEGSPAEKEGVLKGDVIVKVENMDVTPENMDKAVSMMKGKAGETVKVTFERNGKQVEKSLVRSEIKMISVKGEMLDKEVGYIQITSFDEDVATQFRKKLTELKGKGMKGLVLDLRGNPGGYLNECVDIASEFIAKGELVTYTVDKYDKKIESKSTGGDGIGMPLVVLVDGGSASASEVVTGALRDYKAATIIGETTFGKGVVQQLLPVNNGGLKVTTSRYYTPNGENIHKKGIKPDIEVKYPKELLEKEYNRSTDPQFNKALEVIKDKIK